MINSTPECPWNDTKVYMATTDNAYKTYMIVLKIKIYNKYKKTNRRVLVL